MKLILTILLLISSTFASEIKTIQNKIFGNEEFGDNHMIPQMGLAPKKKETFKFYNSNEGDAIMDYKNKRHWAVEYRPTSLLYMIHNKAFCRNSGDELTPELLKTLDLNLVQYLIEKRKRPKGQKDILIFVTLKEGMPYDYKNYKIFSISQNKYIKKKLRDFTYAAYTLCKMHPSKYESNYKFLLKKYNEITLRKQQELQQQEIDKQKRKTIQVAEDTDQGMILQIKGPLVLIQKKVCTMMNNYGLCLSSGKASEWVKRKELTFKKQK